MYQYIIEVLQLDPPDALVTADGGSPRCVAVRCEKRGATCYYDHVNARCTVRMAPAEDDLQLSLRVLGRGEGAATTPGVVLACATERLHVGGPFNHIGACWVPLYAPHGPSAGGSPAVPGEDGLLPCRVRLMWEVVPEKEEATGLGSGRASDARRSSGQTALRLTEFAHTRRFSSSPPPATCAERVSALALLRPHTVADHTLSSRRVGSKSKAGRHRRRTGSYSSGSSRVSSGRPPHPDRNAAAADPHAAAQVTRQLAVQGCAARAAAAASRTRTAPMHHVRRPPPHAQPRGMRAPRPPSPLREELHSAETTKTSCLPVSRASASTAESLLPEKEESKVSVIAATATAPAETTSSATPLRETDASYEPASIAHEVPLGASTTDTTSTSATAEPTAALVEARATDDAVIHHVTAATSASGQWRVDLFATSTQLCVPPEVAHGNLYTAPCPTLLLQLLAKARLSSGDGNTSSTAASQEEEKLLRAWQLPVHDTTAFGRMHWCSGSALQAIRNELHNPVRVALPRLEQAHEAASSPTTHSVPVSREHGKESLFRLTEEEQADLAARAAIDKALRAVCTRHVSRPVT